MNGRIKRFFGTFKAAIRQVVVLGAGDLRVRLIEFRAFYNSDPRPNRRLFDRHLPARLFERGV